VQDRVRDLRTRAQAPERRERAEELVHLGPVERRVDDARRDGRDVDALRRELERERARGGLDAGLDEDGDRGGHARHGRTREAGRDAHDVAPAARAHVPRGALRRVHEAAQVRVDQRVDVLGPVLRERLGEEDARVVHEELDATSFGLDEAEEALGRRRVADVPSDGDEASTGAELAPDALELVARARVADHAIAAREQRLGDGEADAARGTGDDGSERSGTDGHDEAPPRERGHGSAPPAHSGSALGAPRSPPRTCVARGVA
jgi:hypothetical protein